MVWGVELERQPVPGVDFPATFEQFDAWFATEEACRRYLAQLRWVDGFVCPHCGGKTAIFGEGGGRRLSEEMKLPLLGEIPLDPEVRRGGDEGLPIVIGKPASAQAEAFRQLASAVAARVGALSVALPTIS